MTSREADGPLEIHFRIDDRRGVLSPAVISAALRLRIPPRNADGLQRLGPPSAQRDGSSTGQGCYSWSSPLSEAASASYAAHSTICCAPACFLWQHYVQRRGTYLGGHCTGSRAISCLAIRASDDFTTAF